MEVVIVPLHRRPAFALACLTRLYEAARTDDTLLFHLAIDAQPDPGVVTVADQFAQQVGRTRVATVQRTRSFRGNSYNLLTAYAETVDSGASLIHLVEEDVLVADDYFDYHRAVHAREPDVFAVSACRNQFWPLYAGPPAEEDAYYLQGCYQSIGVSFTPAKLRHVTAHSAQHFCINPYHYLRRTYPHSALEAQYAEQDGLIYRIVESLGEKVAFPCVPRAYHAGFTGYNRTGATLSGTVEDQAKQILTMDGHDLNAASQSYQDYETVSLTGNRKPVVRSLEWF